LNNYIISRLQHTIQLLLAT